MFLDPNAGKEFALIKGRKGFVRRAMAHGVPLVPVFGKQGVGRDVVRHSLLTGGRGGGVTWPPPPTLCRRPWV